jgi:hypothetical protein
MQIKKRKSHAFGKDIYLLGQDSEGTNYWLEKASWDCGWYWGFGYVETYTNNKSPEKARHIASHQHIDSTFLKGVSRLSDCPLLSKVTFSSQECWQLTELFKQFYLLKNMAEFLSRKPYGCHVTSVDLDYPKLEGLQDTINKVMLPKIFQAIYDILTPKES